MTRTSILQYLQTLRPDLEGTPNLTTTPLRMLLNSVEFVTFLAFLEHDLGIVIDDSSVTEENFENIETVIGFIEKGRNTST